MKIRIRGTIQLSNMLSGLLFALFLCGVASSTHVSAASSDSLSSLRHGFCISQNVPVSLAVGQRPSQSIHTTYCQPYRAMGQRQVDVLTEGATYNSMYWMWPQNPDLYSYADKTLAAGRSVFTYDRLGSGQSSHPVSTTITMPGDAFILHQFVGYLHLLGFQKINSIGHSYGSGIAMHEGATYNDVSRVVLTGYLHLPSNPAVTAGNYPANQDPAFAGQNLDSGYLTTRPTARQTSFYSASADPAVVAFDNAHKDLVSASGFTGFFGDRNTPAATNISNNIKAPVLVMVGDRDAVFCYNPSSFNCSDQTAIKSNEAPYYTSAASLTTTIVANTGHDIALHPSANESFKFINHWIQTH